MKMPIIKYHGNGSRASCFLLFHALNPTCGMHAFNQAQGTYPILIHAAVTEYINSIGTGHEKYFYTDYSRN
jgi:hypothetical protein